MMSSLGDKPMMRRLIRDDVTAAFFRYMKTLKDGNLS